MFCVIEETKEIIILGEYTIPFEHCRLEQLGRMILVTLRFIDEPEFSVIFPYEMFSVDAIWVSNCYWWARVLVRAEFFHYFPKKVSYDEWLALIQDHVRWKQQLINYITKVVTGESAD